MLQTFLKLATALMLIGSANADQRYLVSFTEPPILERDPTILKSGARAKAMFESVQSKQTQRLVQAESALRLKLVPEIRVHYTNNLVVLKLSEEAAEKLRAQAGIASVTPDFSFKPQSDVSANFVGAANLWQSSDGLAGSRGAGVLVGVLDSGINATHPSFANTSKDGYVFPANFARRGLCTTFPAQCNNKLVGIYDFTEEGARDGRDLDGHGTHVAGIAVGNVVDATVPAPTLNFFMPISGIAPRAHLISYKVCADSCAASSVVAAIERAVLDGVHVLNFSLAGFVRTNPFEINDPRNVTIRAMFNARSAGLLIAAGAGNSGPVSGTLSSQALAPWVFGVASISHDRRMQTRLFNLSGASNPPRLSFDGLGLSAGLVDRPILLAERFGHRLCGQGDDSNSVPNGSSNPFAQGTFAGEIVVCERGVQSRVAKGFNLKLAGAGGMILINTELEGESTVADPHYLPTVHLGQRDGAELIAWLRQAGQARGSISGTQLVRGSQGDQLRQSSSRGPSSFDYLKPDLAAPGFEILAADLNAGTQIMSGTSMATPQVTGAIALLRALKPSWGADEIESALRTSALAGKIKVDERLARLHEAGAGRLRVDEAANKRAYFPITPAEMLASSDNPSAMNLPSLSLSSCRKRCSLRRMIRGSADLQGSASFSMQLRAPQGLAVAMRPAQFTLVANQSQVLDFDFEITDARVAGQAFEGSVELLATGQASLMLPLRVQSTVGAPKALNFEVNERRGQIHTQLSGIVELPRPNAKLSQFGRIVSETIVLDADGTKFDPFDEGARLKLLRVDSVGGFLWVRVRGGSSGMVTLYVGKDDDGSRTGSVREVRCNQQQIMQEKSCLIALEGRGDYWVIAQNMDDSSRAAEIEIALMAQGVGTESVALMPGHVAENATFPLSFSYDLNGSVAELGARHLAVLELRADASAPAPMSQSLVELRSTGVSEKPAILVRDQTQYRSLTAGQIDSSVGFSLPSGTQSVRVSAQGSAELSLELHRAPLGEANFVGIAAGSISVAQAQAASGVVNLDLTAVQATAGRYYLRIRSTTDQVVSLKLSFENAPQPALEPELYFNPARSGHGMLITRAGNDAQMIWYTYDHLGNPTWYWFFANGYFSANPGVVTGPISRYTWDGSKASSGVVVGQGAITQTGSGKYVFDFDVLGLSGSEPMELLGRSGCALGSGISTAADLTGAWYQPSTTGWGGSVHMSPQIEFTNFFIYDGLGQPRWVLGFEDFANGVALNPKLVTLYQHFGFCPSCAFLQNTRRPVGSYRLRFDPLRPVAYADIELNVTYLDPILGQFNQSGEFYLLTDRKRCQP